MRSLPLLTLLAFVPVLSAAPPVPDAFDSPMHLDPDIPPLELVLAFPDGLLDLWLTALDRPDAETRTQAALAVALAHERGMKGVDAAVPKLLRNLDREGDPAGARLATARALIVLDAKAAALPLFAHLRTEAADYREVAEPVLAKWDHQPAHDLWLMRLNAPAPRYDGNLTLAMRCLAAVKEDRAAAKLRDIAVSAEAPAGVRLEAARPLAAVHPATADVDLARLTTDATAKAMIDRLVAATLLRQHTGDAAVKLLQQLVRDPEPAVALVAVTRLLEIDPQHVLAVAEPVFASPDAGVRRVGVDALFRLPTADHIRQLGDRLDDPHPDVRAAARRALRELAGKPDLRDAVVEQVKRAAGAKGWRPQEQAAVLLAQLDLKGEVKLVLGLLKSDRPEVMAASGWAVRVLGVPEAAAEVLEFVRGRRDQILRKGVPNLSPDGMDRQLAQLIQFLVAVKHTAADAELRPMVPRQFFSEFRDNQDRLFAPLGPETRQAAVWALGKFHSGDPEPELVELLEPRLTGDGNRGRDDFRIRRMAVVALGRTGAKAALPRLEQYADDNDMRLNARELVLLKHTCRCAIAKINGTDPPPPARFVFPQTDWFLTPLK